MTAPRYVAIITDGNGRWAEERGLPVGAGHRAGAETVRETLRHAVELGVRELLHVPEDTRGNRIFLLDRLPSDR